MCCKKFGSDIPRQHKHDVQMQTNKKDSALFFLTTQTSRQLCNRIFILITEALMTYTFKSYRKINSHTSVVTIKNTIVHNYMLSVSGSTSRLLSELFRHDAEEQTLMSETLVESEEQDVCVCVWVQLHDGGGQCVWGGGGQRNVWSCFLLCRCVWVLFMLPARSPCPLCVHQRWSSFRRSGLRGWP